MQIQISYQLSITHVCICITRMVVYMFLVHPFKKQFNSTDHIQTNQQKLRPAIIQKKKKTSGATLRRYNEMDDIHNLCKIVPLLKEYWLP